MHSRRETSHEGALHDRRESSDSRVDWVTDLVDVTYKDFEDRNYVIDCETFRAEILQCREHEHCIKLEVIRQAPKVSFKANCLRGSEITKALVADKHKDPALHGVPCGRFVFGWLTDGRLIDKHLGYTGHAGNKN
jgi:hypothetical protein